MKKEELLSGYFEKQLSKEQEAELQALLQTDAEFKEAFTKEYELWEAIKKEERAELKARLRALDNKGSKTSKTFWLVAAGILVVLGIGWLLNFNTSTDMTQLYAQHFEPYPNVVAPAVRNSDVTTDRETLEAFQLYDSRKYEEAAGAFYHIFQTNNSDDAFFYYTMSLMSSDHTEAAVSLLQNYNWQNPEKYETLSHWYLAMGHLKLERKEPAVSYLQLVAKANAPLSPKAKSLLQELGK